MNISLGSIAKLPISSHITYMDISPGQGFQEMTLVYARNDYAVTLIERPNECDIYYRSDNERNRMKINHKTTIIIITL